MSRKYRQRRVNETVSTDVACRRALMAMDATADASRSPWIASQFADAIWPGHRMSRQGAALAGSRVMRLLARCGHIQLARRTGDDDLGWRITEMGRCWLESTTHSAGQRGRRGKRGATLPAG